jgi:DNA topoisomerase-1
MKLLIVESPSKAKTIEKYLGGDFTVRASIGHVRDLPKTNRDAIDIPGGFIPRYEISLGKGRVISELQSLAKRADEIILSPDPDREGEAIAWHLEELLKQANITKPISRVTFNEITPGAILEALKHPRSVDRNLVQAQEARRVLDRLVGYDLSGLIWKKVRYGLSAGRVQSPALRIIMEREREIRAFIPEQYFVLDGLFKTASGDEISLTCAKEISNQADAERILKLGNNNPWSITDIKESEQKRSPRAPFTTSTLQQAASSRLGFTPSRTMQAAQKLYEAGAITYMRTDSTNLSKSAQASILSYIEKKHGRDMTQFRTYATKSKNAQEAHEAIRPTHVEKLHEGVTSDQQSLYKLIWERTVASQMADAKVLKTKVVANITSGDIPDFTVTGSRILSLGWLSVDTGARGEDVELPQLSVGENLQLLQLNNTEKYTTPPNRYSEAGLIKELEERGIGRPSTYASIMKTLEDRGYVTKEGRTLFPTDTGDVVSSFLEENFTEYISDTFTADMEDKLDDIAGGKRQYVKTLSDFYTPFSADVASKENIPKVNNLGQADEKHKCPKCGSSMEIKLGRTGKFLSCARYPDCDGALTIDGAEVGEEKPFGMHPSGQPIYLLTGRFGPYVQLGKSSAIPKLTKWPKGYKKTAEDKEQVKAEKLAIEQAKSIPGPKRASLPPRTKPENLTLEAAIKLLELPRDLGTDPETGIMVIANVGRFGPYVGRDRDFRSIKKGMDPYTITLDQALTLLNTPKQLPKGCELVRTFINPKGKKEMQVLRSKSGHFIKSGLKRIYLPDNMDPTVATDDELVAMLAVGVEKKKK